MKTIILSAGQGRRLLPLTEETPKSVLPIGEKSALGWQLAALEEAGASEVVLIDSTQEAADRGKSYSTGILDKGISRRKVADSSGIGRIIAVSPSTRPILTMLEPIALPKARPGSPRTAANAETRISGAEVAKATIVRPISSGAIPMLRAVADAP